MEDKKIQQRKILLIFIFSVLLAILLSSFFSRLYERLIGPLGGGFIGPSCPECFSGFLGAYTLFVGLSIIGIFGIRKYKTFIWFIIPVFAIDLFITAYSSLIIDLGFAFTGFILGLLIFFIASKLKKPTPPQQ